MSFVFYDTETTGLETSFEQILQFAAVRTDADLKEIERFEIRSRLLPHVVPSPGAMRVTNTRVARLTDSSLPSHYEMIRAIRNKLLEWSPCTFIGYNSLNYDEHLLRQALYKTLHNPYLTNSNNNCRSDVLRMMQAASLSCESAFNFPEGDKGRVFKLDRLAPANGFNHTRAHDAMGDVEATIYLCRLLSERAPDVYSSFMRFSQKAAVADYIQAESIFCLSDFYVGKPYSYIVTVIGNNSSNTGEYYAYDLAVDPESLLSLSSAQLSSRLKRSPKIIRRLKCNSAPMITAVEDAPSIAQARNLSAEELERRVNFLHSNEEFKSRIVNAFDAIKEEKEKSPHIEEQIYDGFSSQADQTLMEEFHNLPWEKRIHLIEKFEDQRLKALAHQLIYFEQPHLLENLKRQEVDQFTAKRLLGLDNAPCFSLAKALEEVNGFLFAPSSKDEAILLQEHKAYLESRLQHANTLYGNSAAKVA